MNKIKQINGKLSLLFIAAILILCTGFLILGCGNKPQKKTATEKGSFAADFSLCPATASTCTFLAEKSNVPDLSAGELTIEAWVKRKTDAVNGGIFSRMDPANGVALFVNNNEPEFAIRIATGASTSTPGVTGSVDYIVGSGFSLVQNTWTHIVGLVSNAAHTHVASATCTTTVMAETPHLDIYINGAFSNCATTWGDSADPATGPQFADNPGHSQMAIGTVQSGPVDTISERINAFVDEVRVWSTARSAADIQSCMNTELGIGGTCDRGDNKLKAYYRFNEGEGSDVTDISGNDLSGSLLYFMAASPGEEFPWIGGWVAGNPSLQRAD